MLFTITICVVVLLATNKTSWSQDAMFSQFYGNPLYLNPAFAGSKKCTRLILNYRNQPFPAFGTFATYSISGDMYSDKLSGGLGFNVIHDSRAQLLSHTQAGAFYAWQSRLSHTWSISLGFQTSYFNERIHSENLVFPDQYNPGGGTGASGETFSSTFDSHYIDFSSGFLIYNKNFYSGVSVHHLNQPERGIFQDQKLNIKYSFMAGYDFALTENSRVNTSNNITLSPNVIFQSQSGFTRLNYGMYAHIENFTAGLWLRHNLQHPNTLIFTFGLKQVNYAIGYSYDYSLSGFSSPQGGAHELGVLLNFNCPAPKNTYRILNCPTF